ncbi:PepSY domain-containing protein [Azovibrio restrictus]|uniref:PepSY domain-containing protein n=1 Tax=Azovibrio restrictus TaxID=146938 RepID=UPI0026ED3E71|nr:PepSY domain-containing protein [Azovibrio restrictus]
MNGKAVLTLGGAALALALAGFPAAPAGAGEAEDHEQARQALAAGEVLPLRQILDRVEKRHPGQILEVELEREQGRWIYEIKLLRPEGAVSKLKLDARNGDLLQQKTREKP